MTVILHENNEFRERIKRKLPLIFALLRKFFRKTSTPRQKSIRALEIFRVQKLILNATS